jgi:hypothetical protein
MKKARLLVVTLCLFAVLLAGASSQALAQTYYCKICDTDYYGLWGCYIVTGPPGPEGYTGCAAYSWGCALWNPCLWT